MLGKRPKSNLTGNIEVRQIGVTSLELIDISMYRNIKCEKHYCNAIEVFYHPIYRVNSHLIYRCFYLQIQHARSLVISGGRHFDFRDHVIF